MTNSIRFAATICAVFLSSLHANAAVSVTAFSPNELQANIQFEGQGTISISPLPIDQSPSGATQVNVGSTIRSYLVQFTNPSASSIDGFYAAIEVGRRILGVQTELLSLRSTRFALDAEGDFDGAAPAGHLESNDSVSINGSTISLKGTVGNNGVDPIRIFTAVPEPVSLTVWSAMAGLGMVATRRRRS